MKGRKKFLCRIGWHLDEWSDMDDSGCWKITCLNCGRADSYRHWDSRCG